MIFEKEKKKKIKEESQEDLVEREMETFMSTLIPSSQAKSELILPKVALPKGSFGVSYDKLF